MSQPLTRSGIAACAICRKQLARGKRTAKSKSGLLCHPWCLKKATEAGKGGVAKAAPKSTPRAPVQRPPAPRALPASPFANRRPEKLPDCPICGLARRPADQVAETEDGWAHLACVEGGRKAKGRATVSAFAKNKERIESGVTFAGHKASGYRLGASPSSTGGDRRR